MGVSEGGPMALMFAAAHPTRVAALAIYGSLPRFTWAPDFPWGLPRADWERTLEDEVRRWGTVEMVHDRMPWPNEAEAELMARRQRLSASPDAWRQLERMNMEIDVRDVLPAIAVPTLILHRDRT